MRNAKAVLALLGALAVASCGTHHASSDLPEPAPSGITGPTGGGQQYLRRERASDAREQGAVQ
jgi:hypothetical protein